MDHDLKDKYIQLGLNLAYYRKMQNFTQEMLAEAIGMERQTISKLENASIGSSLDTIFKIANALEIEPYKLFMPHD